MIAVVGQVVDGVQFSRDLCREKLRVEAVGFDWVVARPVSEWYSEKYGPQFATFDPSYCLERWKSEDEI